MKILYASNTFEEIYIDDENYDLVKYAWTVITKETGCKQVMRTKHITKGRGGLKENIFLGRVIAERMGLNIYNMDIDHIDRNGLNNQRSNIRLCTPSQNGANSKLSKINTSGYRGSSFNYQNDKYEAYIKCNYKRKFLGYYDTAEEAGIAYDIEAIKLFKEFANLNFPQLRDFYLNLTPSILGIKGQVSECLEVLTVEALC